LTDNRERLGIYLSPKLKDKLRDVSEESSYSLNSLGLMALSFLVSSYEKNGVSIFEELLKIKNDVDNNL
jgi:hypothetical protein